MGWRMSSTGQVANAMLQEGQNRHPRPPGQQWCTKPAATSTSPQAHAGSCWLLPASIFGLLEVTSFRFSLYWQVVFTVGYWETISGQITSCKLSVKVPSRIGLHAGSFQDGPSLLIHLLCPPAREQPAVPPCPLSLVTAWGVWSVLCRVEGISGPSGSQHPS